MSNYVSYISYIMQTVNGTEWPVSGKTCSSEHSQLPTYKACNAVTDVCHGLELEHIYSTWFMPNLQCSSSST